jgi:hypothetical protein
MNFNNFYQCRILYSNILHIKVHPQILYKPYPLCIHTFKQTSSHEWHSMFQNNAQHLELSEGAMQHITIFIQF